MRYFLGIFIAFAIFLNPAHAQEFGSSSEDLRRERREIQSLLRDPNIGDESKVFLKFRLREISFSFRKRDIPKKLRLSPVTLGKNEESNEDQPVEIYVGKASFYADKFHGRKTASGEIFSNDAMTAAHKTLPFGTRMKVNNPRTGASIIITINDRGPYAKNRILDLSKYAFSQLAPLSRGVIDVYLEILRDQ